MRKRVTAAIAAAMLVGTVGITVAQATAEPAPASTTVEASIFGDTGRWFCRRLGLFC